MDITGAWSTDLAGLLKKDGRNKLGPLIGSVISTSPFKISVMGGEVVIRSDIHEVYISDNPADRFSVTHEHGTATVGAKFKNGDTVLVIPDESEKAFFITDNLRKV